MKVGSTVETRALQRVVHLDASLVSKTVDVMVATTVALLDWMKV